MTAARLTLIAACAWNAGAQVIEFESNGLHYQTLTRGGLTIMYAHLPTVLKDYTVLQVAVSNGSPTAWTIKPEDFHFEREAGEPLRPEPARKVVERMLDHAGRNEVIRLVSTYEMSLYGLSRITSTNGYEQRRQAALAEVSSARIKAAAAASAIAFVNAKLAPGESTDGAVFYLTHGKPWGAGRLRVRAAGEVFEFDKDTPPAEGAAK
ncbi:MAG: hypothetical protein FJW40_17505 [Acidobacteria bacterium]|nr:hypothetical protein [Acidobacteriota bacterium]